MSQRLRKHHCQSLSPSLSRSLKLNLSHWLSQRLNSLLLKSPPLHNSRSPNLRRSQRLSLSLNPSLKLNPSHWLS